VTALGKLFRTTAFKLSLVYLIVFALFAAFLLGYFAWNTHRLVNEQITETVDAEITGLSEQYRQAGLRRLVLIVDARSRRPGSSLYLVTMPTGEALAGNIGSLEPGTLDQEGWKETSYRRLDETAGNEHQALVRVSQLSGGFRLLVGRDLEERQRVREIIAAAGKWSIAVVLVLGLAGGFFIIRRVLKRVDAMTATTQTIMAGNFGGRLPIAGTGDELDRLAENLNTMLERIEALMRGLKEVSDNIAHDLKTPLTRLRNRADQALRGTGSPDELRKALEGVIEESDNLIRVFNALLMIARLEAGSARETMAEFDAAEVARGVAELYDAAAEDAGCPLEVSVEPNLPVHGNRELVGQALANLLDNALKYSTQGDGQRAAPVTVVAGRAGDRVVISVGDRGPGIPAEERGRVLERFVRLEGARTRPGFGLGLSLAAAVARLHGGALILDDNDPGLKVTLSLPARVEGAA
jgi:signal transduction histidine kinase